MPNANDNMLHLLERLNAAQYLPKVKPVKYNGDPLRWTHFKRYFETNVAQYAEDDQTKLLNLIEHCEREPRARIEFCLGLSNPSDACRKAWQILRETYGDSNEVVKTYTFKLQNGPHIAAKDSEGLWNFACELKQCWYTMDDIGNMSPLNDSYNLALISKRLPTHVRERWARRAEEIRADGAVATFSDLVQLVKREAKFARSYYKKMYEATEDKGEHQKVSASNQKRASANAISVRRTSNGSAEQKRRFECPLCLNDHSLAYCEEYEKRTPEQRGELVRKRYLCFNCLRPGHMTRSCKSKYSCNEECGRRHHSSLHALMTRRETKEKTSHDTASCATSQSNATSCAVGTNRGVFLNVVPVKVTAPNGKSVNTYALLDSGSNDAPVRQKVATSTRR